jgi:hypothetical protein
MADSVGRRTFLPSMNWRETNVHWHAYLEREYARASDLVFAIVFAVWIRFP